MKSPAAKLAYVLPELAILARHVHDVNMALKPATNWSLVDTWMKHMSSYVFRLLLLFFVSCFVVLRLEYSAKIPTVPNTLPWTTCTPSIKVKKGYVDEKMPPEARSTSRTHRDTWDVLSLYERSCLVWSGNPVSQLPFWSVSMPAWISKHHSSSVYFALCLRGPWSW